MKLRSIDLNLLAVFDAIAVEGNLTRAAKKLGMSQPAMSNALARLRETLDDPLFVRSGRGMESTPRARIMAEPIRQALDLMQNSLRLDSAFDYASSNRTFTVAVEDYGEAVVMPRFMEWLNRVAPGVRVRIRPEPGNALLAEMKSGSIDMAMEYHRSHDEDFKVQPLMEETLVSMVRQGHPLVGDSLSLEQYVSLAHVIIEPRSPRGPVVDRELKKRGLTREIALQVPHFLSMPLIVRTTDFICTLPLRMARVYAEHFRLKVLKPPIDFPSIPIYLVWSKRLDADPGHQWFRNSFHDLCQRL